MSHTELFTLVPKRDKQTFNYDDVTTFTSRELPEENHTIFQNSRTMADR